MQIKSNQTIINPQIQTQKDIYKDTPVRYLGFTNELGTAFKEICTNSNGITKHIPSLSYVPAFGYIACDVIDKYKKGEDGTGEKSSIKMGARELLSQITTSVLAPTGVIIGTQKVTKAIAKKAAPKLPEKLVSAFTKNNGKLGKIATLGISLTALVAATKPIDKITEKVFEKIIDPLLGINKKQNENIAETLQFDYIEEPIQEELYEPIEDEFIDGDETVVSEF